jgi:hypothetical protein
VSAAGIGRVEKKEAGKANVILHAKMRSFSNFVGAGKRLVIVMAALSHTSVSAGSLAKTA